MSTMPSVGSGTYSPGPNMVCSPQQEKVGTGSIEASTYPVYIDLRIRATVSPLQGIYYKKIQTMGMDQAQQCARFLDEHYRDANDLLIGVNSLLSRFVFGVEN